MGFWGIGLGLAVAALIPGLNRVAYLAVYLPASFVGHYVSKIVLFLVFFLVFAPIGILLRVLGKDLLRLRPAKPRAVWTSVKSVQGVKPLLPAILRGGLTNESQTCSLKGIPGFGRIPFPS